MATSRVAQMGWADPELDTLEIKAGVRLAIRELISALAAGNKRTLAKMFESSPPAKAELRRITEEWQRLHKQDKSL